jgi:hypothetical protein
MVKLKEKLRIFIEENLEKSLKPKRVHPGVCCSIKMPTYTECSSELLIREPKTATDTVADFIKGNKDLNDFQTVLFRMIEERGLNDSEVYNKVHIDRRLFSKIRSDKNYHPSKETVILLGLSLELNEKEISELLHSAAYSLPKNNHYDLIIRFCFINRIYDIISVNDLLDEYNCKLFNY